MVKEMPSGAQLRFLEHTADVGLAVTADTLPELFRAAANGLFQLVLGEALPEETAGTGTTVETRRVTVRAGAESDLLVAWLRELLYQYESAALYPVRIDFETLTANLLDATLHCAHSTAVPQREIKGVTYHQLRVQRQDGRWHAQVIFDV